MIQAAEVGIAFMPKDERVAASTGNVVRNPDMLQVLEFAA
jgi:hypothetical protein